MKHIYFSLLMVFIITRSLGQAPDWQWIHQSSDTPPNHADGGAVAADTSGYLYLTGSFNTSIDFGVGTLSSFGDDDAFLMKFDTAGTVIWSVNLGGVNTDFASAVDVDNNGDVIIVGGFNSAANVGGTILSGSGNNAFVAKYDNSGNVLWAKTIFEGSAWEVITDNDNNVYVVGIKVGTVAGESFLVKYNSNGVLQWVRNAIMTTYGGGNNSHSYGVDIDVHGNVYTVSSFNGQAEIDGQVYLPTLTTGGYDALIMKYSPVGNLIWTEQIQTQLGTTTADDLLVLNNGSFCVTGGFNGTIVSGLDTVYSVNSGYDMYITCFDTSGANQWTITNNAGNRGNDLATDMANNIYVLGIRASPSESLMVGKYGSDGTHHWEKSILGTLATGNVSGICKNNFGEVYVGGAVGGNTSFDNVQIVPNAGRDIFWAKLGAQCIQNPLTLEVNQTSTTGVGCDVSVELIVSGGEEPYSYQWDANADNQTTNELTNVCPGEYCVTVVDANGCSQNICVLVTTIVEVDENHNRGNFEFYPNPNNGQFNIQMSTIQHCDVQVFNSLGQSVFSRQLNSTDRVTVELPTVGVYHLVVKTDEAIYTEKVVVQ